MSACECARPPTTVAFIAGTQKEARSLFVLVRPPSTHSASGVAAVRLRLVALDCLFARLGSGLRDPVDRADGLLFLVVRT